MWKCWFLSVLFLFKEPTFSSKIYPPSLPLQFDAELETIAHLVDKSQSYPPWKRIIKIRYDYIKKLASAEILEGYEAGKIYVRRYDQKREYMVKLGKYKECQRAYLGESMPTPQLGDNAVYYGVEHVRGQDCEHWVIDDADERTHIYQTVENRIPIRLLHARLYDGQETPLMTYEFINMNLGEQDIAHFEIPQGYSHKECFRNVGGFPYIHAFHHYLRF